MKKKFVLTLALVLMVAVTLTAATPVEVSGTFKAGYALKFGSGGLNTTRSNGSATLNTVLSFSGDFWKVSLAQNSPVLFQDADGNTANAKADIYLDKALAAEGVDMGDITATLHVGTSVGKGAPNVFANTYDVAAWKKNAVMSGPDNFGVTLGYGTLASVYVAYDPVAGDSMVIGGKVTPIDGVSVAFGFTNDQGGDNAIGASVAADIAKLAGLDFGLKATAEYHGTLATTAKHHIAADIAGSYEGIGLWVQYLTDDVKTHALATKASYKTTVEGVTLSAGVLLTVTDLSDFKATYEVAADAKAEYKLGGVAYSLAGKYEVAKKTFTLTPAVAISF